MSKVDTYVYYRYSELDNQHQYFLDMPVDIFSQWVWFYLGANFNSAYKKHFHLFPFKPPLDKKKVLAKYKSNAHNASGLAYLIFHQIFKHKCKVDSN